RVVAILALIFALLLANLGCLEPFAPVLALPLANLGVLAPLAIPRPLAFTASALAGHPLRHVFVLARLPGEIELESRRHRLGAGDDRTDVVVLGGHSSVAPSDAPAVPDQ